MPRIMTERIAISEPTKKKLTEFRDGAGMSYDGVISLLLDLATLEGEDIEGSAAEIGYATRRGRKINHVSIEQE